MIRSTTFAGKRVAVFGLGGSGNATARALIEGGADVAAWDDNEASRNASAALGIPIVDLSASDWRAFAGLVLAPGVPLTHPEPHWTVKKALAAGIEVIGDVELYFREREKVCPEAKVVAITGTNGKSTTTALTAHILRTAGVKTEMGGNIGRPVLDLAPFTHDTVYVLELSTFQIDLTPTLKPTVGVLLNLTPDHLDRHGPASDTALAMRNYAAIKERLVASATTAVVGVDDEFCRAIADRCSASGGGVRRITSGRPNPNEFGCIAGKVCHESGVDGLVEVASIAGVPSLRGAHNAQNAVAAYAATRDLVATGIAGKGHETFGAAFRSFPGLAHRMEEIGALPKDGGRVLFINDSKATNADSTEKALASFDRDIFWILGGKPKEGGVASLKHFFPRIAKAYLIGKASDEFAATLEGKVTYERCGTLDVALAAAARDAFASPGAEPVVLLSPACASYDQFKSFEHRGDTFRQLVAALAGIRLKGGA